MPVFNMIPYGIRVILDKKMHKYISQITAPVDIEGTVLSITTQDPKCESMIRKGDILNVLFNSSFPVSYNVKVRWDNDVKHSYSGNGILAFRSGGKGLYSNIWNKEELSIDETPFHKLKPYTKNNQHTDLLLEKYQMKVNKYKHEYNIIAAGKGKPIRTRGYQKMTWTVNPFTDEASTESEVSLTTIPSYEVKTTWHNLADRLDIPISTINNYNTGTST